MSKTSIIQCMCISVPFLCIALLQVQNVNCQDQKTTLPFCIRLLGTLRVSQVIKITGMVYRSTTPNAIPAPWLNVILNSECSNTRSPFYLRMQEIGNTTTIAGNTFDNGHWEEEKSGKPITLPPTGRFVLLIEIQSDGYQVTGSGVPLWTLPHKLSYTDIATLTVRGQSADIRKIELIDQAVQDPQINTQLIYPVPLEQPVSNPTFPFWGYFPGGLQLGKTIRIKGIFPADVPGRSKTSINLCKDRITGPIMLHFDIRFKFSRDTRVIVRNFYLDGQWNPTEERDGPFPFQIGEEFTMLIHVQPDYYNISVNGEPCWTYNHRLPFTEVNEVIISGSRADILEVAYIDMYEKNAALEELTTGNDAKSILIDTLRGYRVGIYIALFVLVNYFLPTM